MIFFVFVAIAVAVVVLVFIVAMRPDDFRVTRSCTISAPVEKVFPHVNELRKWEAWSPWAKLDPNAKIVFEGPAAGTGAIMRWAGNRKVGEGSMTIAESCQDQVVRLSLEFLKPFKATNMAEFIFRRDGGQTVITWNMWGKNDFMTKAFGLVVNCQKMIGKDFEKGLTQLKVVAEASSR